MNAGAAEWPVPPTAAVGAPEAGGLRERKKRLMRQQLSDTATQLFLERGFDAVRVTEIAEACGVSEKTVFNYFPTKESLILDRLESTMASVKTGLADPGASPVQAVLRILNDELRATTSWLATQDDPAQASAAIRRFGTLIRDTPSLRAYQSDMMDQFTSMTAEILAGRAGMCPDNPEPQIAAAALLGLWRIQYRALPKYLDGARTPDQVHQAVTADVRRAARLISTGLNSFPAFTPARQGADEQPMSLSFARRAMTALADTDCCAERRFPRPSGQVDVPSIGWISRIHWCSASARYSARARPGHACRPAPNGAVARSTRISCPSGATRRVTGTAGSPSPACSRAISASVAACAWISTHTRAADSSVRPPHAATSRSAAASASGGTGTCGWYASATAATSGSRPGGSPIASSNVAAGEDSRCGRPIRAITRSVRSRRRVCAVPSQKRATLQRIHPTPAAASGTAGTVNAGSRSTSLAAISMTTSSV